MTRLFSHLLVIAFCLVIAMSVAFAATSNVAGVPISLGQSVEQVKSALHTDMEPEDMDSAISMFTKGNTFLHLKTKGIWAFFDKNGKVYNIRLDAPFNGEVSGIRLGDKLSKVKSLLGEPIKKPFAFGNKLAYLYVLDDITSLRVDIDDSNEVDTMFLTK